MQIKENLCSGDAPGLSAPEAGQKIYFVRHGKTEWNNQFRYQGSTNISLNEEGRTQALRAALRFEGKEIDAVITSPLSRAKETAEIIASKLHGVELEESELLTEVNFGEWEGLTVPEIKAKSGEELFYKWRMNEFHVCVPGGEDMDALYVRACAAARSLLSRSEEKILVVGHGAMFRILFLAMLDIPRMNIFWKTRIDNCSISALNTEKGKRVVLDYLNDTAHLIAPIEEISHLPLL